jgi:hypothetical protein
MELKDKLITFSVTEMTLKTVVKFLNECSERGIAIPDSVEQDNNSVCVQWKPNIVCTIIDNKLLLKHIKMNYDDEYDLSDPEDLKNINISLFVSVYI